MTSRNWYFSLAKEDMKRRIWLIALTALILFFTFPIMAILYAGAIDGYENYQMGIQMFQEQMYSLAGPENGWMVFLIVIAAAVYGFSGFGYLNSKSQVDFYHSIPVRREKLFLVNFFDGFVSLAILYACFLSLAVIVGVVNGAETTKLVHLAVRAYGVNMSFFLLLYATVITAAMMTGKLIVGILGSGVFFFYFPILGTLIYGLCDMFLFTFYDNGEVSGLILRLSPMTLYIMTLGTGEYLKYGIAAIAAGIIIMLFAFWLYKKRPSEGAGKSLVFPISKQIIRIAIVICSGLGGAAFGWALREQMGWAIFFLVCGIVISHCIIEVIYNADFKKLFSHPVQMAGCALISIAVILGFRYDLLGYDRYQPVKSSLSSVSIDIYPLDNWVEHGHIKDDAKSGSVDWEWGDRTNYLFEHMQLEDVEPVLELAAIGIEEAARSREHMTHNRYGEWEEYGQSRSRAEQYIRMAIQFNKSGGSTTTREYMISHEQAETFIAALYQQESFKTVMYPIMNQQEPLSYVRYTKFDDSMDIFQAEPERAQALRQAYCQDLMEQTVESRKSESPVARLRFVTEYEDQLMRQYYSSEYPWKSDFVLDYAYYPIYPSFQRTLACLAEAGIDAEEWPAGLKITSGELNVDVDAYQQSVRQTEHEYASYESRYIDLTAAEVEALLPILVYENEEYMNMFRRSEGYAFVWVNIRKSNSGNLISDRGGTESSLRFMLPFGEVPEHIQQKIENSL